MPITLEPFVRFTCFNFCLTALASYFHHVITAGASDPYRRQNSAAAGSYRQPCSVYTECTLHEVCSMYCYYMYVEVYMQGSLKAAVYSHVH